MNFSDYKACYSGSDSDDEISDHQLSNKFDKIKSASVDWYFILESIEDTSALAHFIAAQLRTKKIAGCFDLVDYDAKNASNPPYIPAVSLI